PRPTADTPALADTEMPLHAGPREAISHTRSSVGSEVRTQRIVNLATGERTATADITAALEKSAEIVIRSEDKQWNYGKLQELRAEAGFVLPEAAKGTTLVALVIRDDIKLTAAEQQQLLVRDDINRPGPEAAPPAEDADRNIMRVQSLKSVMTVGEPNGQPSDIATAKLGQPAEIRLLADPSTLGVGADLPLRAYLDGSAIPAARLSATLVGRNQSIEISTDSKGIGRIRVTEAGEWLVVLHVFAQSNIDATTWTWHTATFSFTVPNREAE
ncbi:MAG: DUF4198 domain-containing protein, partial [Phycisphaerae bacterium]